jgi:alkylation response protein AidB-like acyl-CoA dehydrogenase
MAIDLLPDDDQAALVATVTDILEGEAERAGGDGSGTWDALVEIGVFGLAVPEEAGGVGLGLAELALVFRAFGRYLTPGPLVGGVVAAQLAARAGDDALLARVLGGARVALAEPAVGADAPAVDGPITAQLRGLDLDGAELVLVLTESGAALLDASTVTLTIRPSLDSTVSSGLVTTDAANPILAEKGDQAWTTASLLVACLLGGIAEGAVEDSAKYVKVREQFGAPIGSFQAVKHRCAQMALLAESATSLAGFAALSLGAGEGSADTQLLAARVYCAEAARENAAGNIQNHGGMGFTMEASPHRFARRTATYANAVGALRAHLDRLASKPTLGW